MKATELIKSLQSLVNECGDMEVEVNGKRNIEIVITPCSFLEIDSVDIYPDSNNFQILVKNE